MNMIEVLEKLRQDGIVTHTKALHTTAMYFQLWREGSEFDLSKKAVQTHRARLRKIGIDIAAPYSESSTRIDEGL